jgi:hypothetical protein
LSALDRRRLVAGADARLRLCALSVAVSGFGGSLRLALPVGAASSGTRAVEHGYARHVIGGLADRVDVIDTVQPRYRGDRGAVDATLRSGLRLGTRRGRGRVTESTDAEPGGGASRCVVRSRTRMGEPGEETVSSRGDCPACNAKSSPAVAEPAPRVEAIGSSTEQPDHHGERAMPGEP